MREISLWLHNKLGGSDTWISGSIAGQFSKDVLVQIKEIFTELQAQVKLKLLLSFFHIPRRHIDEVNYQVDIFSIIYLESNSFLLQYSRKIIIIEG